MIHIIPLTGTLVCETGLHIGNAEGICSPRGLDAPVLQNPVLQKPKTIAPYISATALKGKLRNIAEYLFQHNGFHAFRDENDRDKKENFNFNRYFRHDCRSAGDATVCEVCSLFGCTTDTESSKTAKTAHIPGRLIFRNAKCANPKTENELKFENTLKRLVQEANPRLNERVVPQTEFQILYQQSESESVDKTVENLNNLIACMRFLEHFYLGGNGSRGYGKVKFKNLEFNGEQADNLVLLQKKLSDSMFIQKLNTKAEEAR
jgi:CRISPR-associated protein Csm3